MNNLQNLNLQELNAQDMKVMDGGVIFIPVLAVWGAAACLTACGITLSLGAGYYNNR